MRVYALTEIGRKISSKDGDEAEMRVIRFLKENKSSTDTELEVVGAEGYILKRMVKSGLIKELTT